SNPHERSAMRVTCARQATVARIERSEIRAHVGLIESRMSLRSIRATCYWKSKRDDGKNHDHRCTHHHLLQGCRSRSRVLSRDSEFPPCGCWSWLADLPTSAGRACGAPSR